MRAGRLSAQYIGSCLAGVALVWCGGMWLGLPGFSQSAFAQARASADQSTDQSKASPLMPDPKGAAAGANALPAFVPSNHLGKLSADNLIDAERAGGEAGGDPASAPPKEPSTGSGASKEASQIPGARAITITIEPILGSGRSETSSLKSDGQPPKWPEFVAAKSLFGVAKKPAPLAARAIGYYSHGCLSGAEELPIDGPAWQEMRLSRNRNWGHPELIALIKRFAMETQKNDGWPGLLVGDISQPRGGPMLTGHASHQVGLDADIWLTPMPNRRLTRKERETLSATSMLDKTGVAVDPKVFTDKQVALIKRAASYSEVERIFVHPAIKKALCTAAGTDRQWLGKVRPIYGHYYHFHIRIKCPVGFGGCKAQTPPTGEDGCGKEVDQWLAKVIPAKSPKPPAPKPPGVNVRPPAPPIMLADLPPECRALLAAKPDPVPVPKDALMTKPAVRAALARAAAARAAFAKEAGLAIVPAAAHPALRPHMKKKTTATAEKK